MATAEDGDGRWSAETEVALDAWVEFLSQNIEKVERIQLRRKDSR